MRLFAPIAIFLLAATAVAELTPDRKIVLGQGGFNVKLMPNHDLLVSGTNLRRFNPDTGLVWTVNERGLRDIDPAGNILLLQGSTIKKLNGEGMLLWSLTFDKSLADAAFDPAVGVVAVTLESGQGSATFTVNWVDANGGLPQQKYSKTSVEFWSGRVVSKNEIYFFGTHQKDNNEYSSSSYLKRFRENGAEEVVDTASTYDINNTYWWDKSSESLWGLDEVIGDGIVYRKRGSYYYEVLYGSERPAYGSSHDSFILAKRSEPGTKAAISLSWDSWSRDGGGSSGEGMGAFGVETLFRFQRTGGKPWSLSRSVYGSSSPMWEVPRPDINRQPSQAFVHHNSLLWSTRRGSPERLYVERVGSTGAIVDSFTGILKSISIFLPDGSHYWFVGPAEAGTDTIAARFAVRPMALRDDYQAEVSTTLSVPKEQGVLANDEMAENATAVLASQPSQGSVNLHADGSFEYTPFPVATGWVNIEYYFVKNGIQSNTATFAIAVGTFAYIHSITPNSVIGGATATGKVTLNRPAPAGGLPVSLTSTSSAIEVPSSVTVPQGATEATYKMLTDGVDQPVERSVIANSGYRTLYAFLRLEKAQLQGVFAPANIVGGKSVAGTVKLNGYAGPAGAIVSLTDNTSAITTPASVKIERGHSQISFLVATAFVSQAYTRTLYASYGGITHSAQITIRPPKLSAFTISPNPIAGGSSAIGKVMFEAAYPNGTAVTVVDNGSEVSTPSSFTTPQGSSAGTFTIGTGAVSNSVTRLVTVSHDGVTLGQNIVINPARLATLTINPSTVQGGASSVGQVQFDGKVASATLVALGSNSSAVKVPGNVAVPANGTGGSFTITTTKVSANATRQIVATHNNITRTAVITLTP